MSEFSEGDCGFKMLGSPAGYVGYREGNRLSDTIRKHPHAVLLFDEFEKARPMSNTCYYRLLRTAI